MSICLIIFGAAVRSDGTPSGTLSRRIEGALAAAKTLDQVIFMPTGGAGKNGIVEADTIASLLLAAGIDAKSIIRERRAIDTFQSILNCDKLLREIPDVEWISPCTSRYHMVRCSILLAVLGWKVRAVQMPSDWGHLSRFRLASYYLKEFLATPYDLVLLLGYGFRRRNFSRPA